MASRSHRSRRLGLAPTLPLRPRMPWAAAWRWAGLIVSWALLASCASAPPPPPPCPADPPGQMIAGGDMMTPAGDAAGSDAVPVGPDDPQLGRADALVTIVEFADFQCPYCAKAAKTLDRVAEVYGPEQVRIVWKHLPLAFHVHARPAAEMSVAVMKLGGSEAFWRFHRQAFSHEGKIDEAKLGELARASGHDARTLAQAMAASAAKVDADLELADSLGVRGTPGFMINGAFLSGAQPFEKFQAMIDAELAAAKVALADGVPRGRLYATRVAVNRAAAPGEGRPTPREPDAPDTTVFAVPIDGSPVLGKADAPVTIVEFTDFQCPFCSRANGVIAEVRAKYGDKVRLVHKARPLPFHPNARPAEHLVFEILARKGNDAFWKTHTELFARQRQLDAQGLGDVAEQMGVPRAQALAAVNGKKHEARITRDELLADDLEAQGTPTFFVNGRRLVGAQPMESFQAVIDEELAKAQALVKTGVRPDRVYDTIVAGGKKAELQLDVVDLPAPGAANPSRGPAGAPVVIQLFSDFECPFCKRLVPTIEELEKAYPGQIRLVFRHHPLPMHPNAQAAAEASMEAFAQGGGKAFWKMHDAMFEAGAQPGGLARQNLEGIATRAGLDVARLRKALDDGKHKAAVDADAKLATDKGMAGTPAAVVGRYLVSGAQPLSKFRRVVDRVLAERKGPKKL